MPEPKPAVRKPVVSNRSTPTPVVSGDPAKIKAERIAAKESAIADRAVAKQGMRDTVYGTEDKTKRLKLKAKMVLALASQPG